MANCDGAKDGATGTQDDAVFNDGEVVDRIAMIGQADRDVVANLNVISDGTCSEDATAVVPDPYAAADFDDVG